MTITFKHDTDAIVETRAPNNEPLLSLEHEMFFPAGMPVEISNMEVADEESLFFDIYLSPACCIRGVAKNLFEIQG